MFNDIIIFARRNIKSIIFMMMKLLIYLCYFAIFIYLTKTYFRQKRIFNKNEILLIIYILSIIDISFIIYILSIFVTNNYELLLRAYFTFLIKLTFL